MEITVCISYMILNPSLYKYYAAVANSDNLI